MKIDEIERIDIDRWQSAHLAFTDQGPAVIGGKTRQFNVYSKSNRSFLGTIKWWGGWRKYVFFPLNSVFDNLCMRQIAIFCEQATSAHMARLPNKKRLKDLEKAKRQRRIKKLAEKGLTKTENSDSMDLSDDGSCIPEGLFEMQVVEGDQENLTPLEIELGTIEV